MKKKCVLCGTEFEANHGNEKYCSYKCARKLQNSKKLERSRSLRNEAKIKEIKDDQPKTDWAAIVKKCNKLNISYGQAVKQGLI